MVENILFLVLFCYNDRTYYNYIIIIDSPQIHQWKICNLFYNNYKEFENIVQYLKNYDDDIVRIIDNTGEIYVSNGQDDYYYDTIEDADCLNNIKNLFDDTHCYFVEKKSDIVVFQLYANRDIGKGIAYKDSSKLVPDDSFIEMNHLDYKNWYYYIQE